MLHAVEGVLIEKNNLFAAINTNGFIVRVFIPSSTYSKLPSEGEACRLYTQMVIGEKSIRLYGFATQEEKNLFNALRKVSKIGAQTALSVLSYVSVEQFYRIVSEKNEKMLTAIPGIGKKTALSIILEFSSKLPKETVNDTVYDVVSALEALGFTKADSLSVAQSVYDKNPDMTIESLIKESLKQLAKDVY